MLLRRAIALYHPDRVGHPLFGLPNQDRKVSATTYLEVRELGTAAPGY